MKNSKQIARRLFNTYHIEKLTHWNFHTEARLYLSKRLNLDRFAIIYQGIKEIQEAERYLPNEVYLYRSRIDNELLDSLKLKYPDLVLEIEKLF